MTFSHRRVIELIQSEFVAVWESVAPVRTATFALGDGKKITGTIDGPQGQQPVEGEFAEGKLTFAMTVNGQNGPMTIGFAAALQPDGTLAGSLNLTAMGMGELPWKAERVKDK